MKPLSTKGLIALLTVCLANRENLTKLGAGDLVFTDLNNENPVFIWRLDSYLSMLEASKDAGSIPEWVKVHTIKELTARWDFLGNVITRGGRKADVARIGRTELKEAIYAMQDAEAELAKAPEALKQEAELVIDPEYLVALKAHDWYYSFKDSSTTYASDTAYEDKLGKMAEGSPIREEMLRVVLAIRSAAIGGSTAPKATWWK